MWLTILIIVHALSAAGLVGAIIFNYFLLRPSLQRIPPPHAVVISQRVGNLFNILGLTALSLLVLTGVLMVYLMGMLGNVASWQFYANPYCRWLAVMVFGWLVTTVSSLIMTLVLRPTLMFRLNPTSNPTLSDVERRRNAQMAASGWLDKLQLVNMAASLLALVAGASLRFGGLF